MAGLNTEELSALLLAERKGLIGFLILLTGDRSVSDEIFQETCLEALRARETFQSGTNFAAWIRAVARIQILRHRRRESRRPLLSVEPEVLDRMESAWSEPPEPGERERSLRDCVGELEPDQKRLLEWRYRESRSHQRIAQETGRSEDAVKMILMRLRKKLQECVESKLRGMR